MENKLEKTERLNQLTQVADQLVSLGIEELESRQEMALLNAVEIEGNNKCPTTINNVAGCGVETAPV